MNIKRAQQSAFDAAKWMTGSSYIVFVTGFVNSIFITRGLGPQAYGVYSYLIWMVSTAVSLAGGGLNVTAIRFIAEAIGRGDIDQGHAIFLRLRKVLWLALIGMSALLLATMFFPAVYPAEVSQRLVLHLVFVVLCAVLRATYMFEVSASKGYSVFHTEAITTTLISLGTTATTFTLYMTGQGLDAYLLLFLVAAVLHPIIAFVLMRRAGLRPSDGPLPDDIKAKLNEGVRWNTSLTLVSMLSSKSMDTYLLGLNALTTYVGFYNIAGSLSKSGMDLLTNGFSSMLLPFISRAQGEGGREKVQEIFSASVRFYQFMGVLVAAGGWLMSELIVHSLYGKAFDEVIPALQTMAIVGGLTTSSASYSAVFIATDNHQARLRFIFAGAGISVATAFIFIPWLGYTGALLSNAVGNILYVAMVGTVAHRSLGIRFPVRNVALQLLAALMALGVVELAVHDPSSIWRSIVATLLFGVLFLVITLNIGAWEKSDLDMLRKNSKPLGRLVDALQLRR